MNQQEGAHHIDTESNETPQVYDTLSKVTYFVLTIAAGMGAACLMMYIGYKLG